MPIRRFISRFILANFVSGLDSLDVETAATLATKLSDLIKQNINQSDKSLSSPGESSAIVPWNSPGLDTFEAQLRLELYLLDLVNDSRTQAVLWHAEPKFKFTSVKAFGEASSPLFVEEFVSQASSDESFDSNSDEKILEDLSSLDKDFKQSQSRIADYHALSDKFAFRLDDALDNLLEGVDEL